MAYNKISRYATWVRTPDADGSDLVVKYHATEIVKTFKHKGRLFCTLDHNGWMGVTTKRKMNQAANEFGLPYGVHQKNNDWFVTTKAGQFAYDWRTFTFDTETGLPLAAIEPFFNERNAA